ncbi:predicted protein [Postia placenta Mad-698-R]|uniref:Uncharacterized protein n=1 Tax=Postia placenta MAD-698-R-SB12 TaxID=670580 RepID=A0A1X6MTP3_9APHY|nr:hypothetical protein POSPLADRAFT_1048898 [Postia placenta MAD-698-R-SB12]EED79274.1 predicted protein [Postia placenta Mad-698-R]OSX59592.1 hypothetical protein POSPLADRAFT_1048898 [Postia placenta MAD-698-R-SB12]
MPWADIPLLDSLHLALITRTVYTCAVSDFSDPKAWIVPSWLRALPPHSTLFFMSAGSIVFSIKSFLVVGDVFHLSQISDSDALFKRCSYQYITMPDNLIFIALFFVLPKLGLNALLATLNARLDLRRTRQHNLSTSGQSMKPLLSPSIRYSSKTEPGSPRNLSGRYLSFQVQAETLPQLPRASRTAMHRVGYADADILEQGLWSPPTIFRSPRQSHFSDD